MVNISVVIPTLNEEKFLPRCLDSLMKQLHASDELIVVDGGSEDETLAIAQSYGAKTILYGGSTTGEARQLGAQQARNPIVYNTDADNVFPDGTIARIKRHFEENPALIALSGPATDTKRRPLVQLLEGPIYTIFQGGVGCNTAYRKEAFLKTNGYPISRFGEAIPVWDELKRLGPVLFDEKLCVLTETDRWYSTSLPSYLIGAGLFGAGLIGAGPLLIGAGLGFTLGQIGVDHWAYLTEPTEHLHHFHIGGALAGLGMTFYGVDAKDWGLMFIGLGITLALQDWLTEPQSP